MTAPVCSPPVHGAAKAASSTHAAPPKGGAAPADAFAAVLLALGVGDAGDAPVAPAADLTLPTGAQAQAEAEDPAVVATAVDSTLAAAATLAVAAVVPPLPGLPAAMLAMAGAHAAHGDNAKTDPDVPADGSDATAQVGAAGSASSGRHAPRGSRSEAADTPALPAAADTAPGPAGSSLKPEPATAKAATSSDSIATASVRPAHEPLAGAHAAHVAQAPDAPQAAPTAPVHQAAVPSHPLDAAFAGDIAAEVQVMAGAGLQRAELQLHPADLGPVRIELTITAQTADVQLHAAHATTREGLENALPQLRQALAASGLQLGQASVGSGAQPQADPGAWREQQARAQQQAQAAASGTPAGSGASTLPALAIRRNRGLLDLYA